MIIQQKIGIRQGYTLLNVILLCERVLDPQAVEETAGNIFEIIGQQERLHVILDLSHLRSLSSLFLGQLVRLRTVLVERQGMLYLAALTPAIRHIFETTGLQELFHIAHDPLEAISQACEFFDFPLSRL